MLRKLADAMGLTNAAKFAALVKKDRSEDPEAFATADSILQAFHSGDGLQWQEGALQPYKLVNLARRLRELQPKSVLELGSGSSTVVFGMWAKETGGQVISVDEHAGWISNTRSMLERFGVADHVKMLQCDKEIDTAKPEACYRLDTLSEPLAPDFLLIDGPALELDGVSYKNAVCTDVFDLPAAGHVFVDMRLPTVRAMTARLDGYDGRVSDRLTNAIRPNFNYFSEFHRTT